MSALTIENDTLTVYLHRDHHDFEHVSAQAQRALDERCSQDDVTVYGAPGLAVHATGTHWGRPDLNHLLGVLSRYNDLTLVFDLAAGVGEIHGVNQDVPNAATLPLHVLRGVKANLWADWCDWNSEHNAIMEDPAWVIAAMSDDYATMVAGIAEGHVSVAEQVPYTHDWTPAEIGYQLLVTAIEDLGLHQVDGATQRTLAQVGKTWQGSLADLSHAVSAAAAA